MTRHRAGRQQGRGDLQDRQGHEVRHRDRRRHPGPDAARRRVPALTPAGPGPARKGSTIPLARTKSPYDVVQAFSGLAVATEQIDIRSARQVARHPRRRLTKDTRGVPGHPAGRLAPLAQTSPAATSRSARCWQPEEGLRRRSADRDEDIVTLFKDSDILLRALVRPPRLDAHRCWSRPADLDSSCRPGQGHPRRPQARAATTSKASSTCCARTRPTSTRPAAARAVLPGVRQHPRHRPLVRHLDREPVPAASRSIGGNGR